MSLINGLNYLGTGLAQFAGAAGLEQQKSDLAKQNLALADQLATNRALNVDQPFQAAQLATTEAGANARTAATVAGSKDVATIGANATLGSATIAANADKELRSAQAREADSRTALSNAQLAKVDAVTGLQKAIADEQAKPNPDPTKIRTLTNQVSAYTTDSQSQSAIASSLATQSATAQMELTRLTQQRDTELNALTGIQYDDSLKAQKQAVVDGLNQQIAAAKQRADFFMHQSTAFTSNRANLPVPGTSSGAAPAPPSDASGQGAAPKQPAPGLINSGAPTTASASTDAAAPLATAPKTADAPSASPPVSGSPSSSTAASGPIRLPGDVGNTTNLDALKTARPDLNIDVLKGKSLAVIGIVMQVVEGRATLPPLGSKNPDAIAIRGLATQVDPTLDEASAKSRMATRVDFTAGPEARAITALNTALGHAGVVADNFTALNNGSFPIKNWAGNAIESAFGDARQGNTQQAVNALASEARRVFNSGTGGGNLTELEEWQKAFPINGSPEQQRGALNQFVQLLDSRLQSLSDQYNRGMGVTSDPMQFLQPHAQQVFQRLTGNSAPGPTGNQLGFPRNPGGATATNRPPLSSILTPPQAQPTTTNPNLLRLWGQGQ